MQVTTSLADLARETPCATRVFMRHRLDFCCGGQRTLAEACERIGLDPHAVLDEIATEFRGADPQPRWDAHTQAELAEFIERHYHAALRRDLPALRDAAHEVERVHAAKPTVPVGLAYLLTDFAEQLESHMRKEEMVLFPLIRRGANGEGVRMPIHVMREDHDMHGADLERIRALTNDLTPPVDACAKWRALYDGLRTLETELMEHIHLENNILFARASSR